MTEKEQEQQRGERGETSTIGNDRGKISKETGVKVNNRLEKAAISVRADKGTVPMIFVEKKKTDLLQKAR